MTENYGRKTLLIVVLCLAAIACIAGPLLVGEKPFRLGLDLQGGTRLVYRFDFKKALEEGKISAADLSRKGEMLQEFATIIHGRVDPKGVMELSLRPEGEDRLVIELPGAAVTASADTFGKLTKAVAADPSAPDGRTIELDITDVKTINRFPLSGGTVQIDSEKIRYTKRSTNVLNIDVEGGGRGAEATTISAHAVGAQVELLTNDDIQNLIENVGDMQFLLSAEAADFSALGTDQSLEQKKVDDWRKANPTLSIDDFNQLAPEKGGPAKGLQWRPRIQRNDEISVAENLRPLVPLVVPHSNVPGAGEKDWTFTGSDLGLVGFTSDEKGYPAVSFEMVTERVGQFADFTGANVDRGMAIVLNGEIVTLATIHGRLSGQSRIDGGRGGFTAKEVQDLITLLRSGSLRIKPVLLDKARVGATLGEQSVSKAFWSSIAALGLVVVFMMFFYHRLGMFSVVGLVINVLLLMGALAFLRATLTLPGVAGVILTLGMAVDSNILIYERLREEMNRGLKLVQAGKAAFDRAAVTIIDSHVTQLIAGMILYFVGTGPIRGFATTLNIGILTTLFTVLVVTEVLVMRDIKRGAKPYTMIKVLEKPTIDFMSAAKIVIPISVLIMIAGLVLFAMLPNSKKLGIDFLGGFTVTARTQEPQKEARITELIETIPGTIGKSATITPITDSGDKVNGYKTYRITFKLEGSDSNASDSAADSGLKVIETALKPVLQRGPVEVALTSEGSNAVQGELYFEDTHSIDDIVKVLSTAGLDKAAASPLPNQAHSFAFTGELKSDLKPEVLASTLRRNLTGTKDSLSLPYRLMSPIPESAFVGAQVGGELRDKAVLAVLLSLLGTILYLRVRFAEYSYGVAVVVSLMHDVLIALGALAFAVWTGILQAELDLAMIAAFLTIIGYSQNDTIVIFDRVRENIPKSKKPLRDVLNDSINETLGRTILTTATVVLTLIVLFAFNVGSRNVLEGFSYCMLVGVLSGAYSTVYVASPVLLWFENRSKRRTEAEKNSTPKGPGAVPAVT